MRTLQRHETNDANRAIALSADDRNPDNGNASHVYTMCFAPQPNGPTPDTQVIRFQDGPIKVCGVNGITQEVLLTILIDRLEGFQSSKWACAENELALKHCEAALEALESRTRARETRGVEGTHAV